MNVIWVAFFAVADPSPHLLSMNINISQSVDPQPDSVWLNVDYGDGDLAS
jgi:hypothetical protein